MMDAKERDNQRLELARFILNSSDEEFDVFIQLMNAALALTEDTNERTTD